MLQYLVLVAAILGINTVPGIWALELASLTGTGPPRGGRGGGGEGGGLGDRASGGGHFTLEK